MKQSGSFNVLASTAEFHPLAIQRNYGSVTGTKGGKKFTQKYDVKGNPAFTGMVQ